MADPSILIPSGLAKLHPQLETSLKSIAGAIQALRQNSGGSSPAGNTAALASQVQALQSQLQSLQAEVTASSTAAAPTAAQFLPAYCVVYESSPGRLSIADSTAAASSYAVAGITTAFAAAGSEVSLAGNGETVGNASWSWSPQQAVFLGEDGALTQLPPRSGWVLAMGVAISATSIFVSIAGPVAVGGVSASSLLQAPLVLASGQLAQLQSGNRLSVAYGGFYLVNAGETRTIPPGECAYSTGPVSNSGTIINSGRWVNQ